MAILSRTAILAAEDLDRKVVTVPEWGGEVIVQELTGDARDEFDKFLMQCRQEDGIDTRGIKAKLVSLSVVDEDGNPIFTEADVQALGRKSAAALKRVADEAQRLSGLGDDAVEEAAKN